MTAGRQAWTDLILEGSQKPGSVSARPMALLDAPRVESDERRSGFNWRSTLLLVVVTGVALLAFAYL